MALHMANIDRCKIRQEALQLFDSFTTYKVEIVKNEQAKVIRLATEMVTIGQVNLKPDIKSYIDNNINLFPLYAEHRRQYDEYSTNIKNLNLTKLDVATELYKYYIKYILDYSTTLHDRKMRESYIKYIINTNMDSNKKDELIDIYNNYCLSLSHLYLDYSIVYFELCNKIVFKNNTYELTLGYNERIPESYARNIMLL